MYREALQPLNSQPPTLLTVTGRVPGGNAHSSPSVMYREALRFIWAQKRSHKEWCYGGGRDDARGICVDNPGSVVVVVVVVVAVVI